MANNIIINGCDFFPDGIGKLSWKVCCDAHDIAYSLGGTIADKINADRALTYCVDTITGIGIGNIMGLGVLVFGGLFFNFKSLGNKNVVTVIKEKFRARIQ